MKEPTPRPQIAVRSPDARDQIVASVHVIRAARVTTPPQGMPAVSRATEAEVLRVAPELVWNARFREGRAVDLHKLIAQLRSVVASPQYSPAQLSWVLHRVLAGLATEDAPHLALQLVHALTDAQLRRIGRGGIAALRAVCSPLIPELNERVLIRLTDELSRRGPLLVHQEQGLTLIADGLNTWERLVAKRRALQMTALRTLPAALGGATLLVREESERLTSQRFLEENLRLCLTAVSPQVHVVLARALASDSLGVIHAGELIRAPEPQDVTMSRMARLAEAVAMFVPTTFGRTPAPQREEIRVLR